MARSGSPSPVITHASAVELADAASSGSRPPTSERREEILLVARDLFFTRGFEAGSMRDLAGGIGLTQAAIYYHFKNKDEILFALVDAFTEFLHDQLSRALHETGDPVEDLRRAVRAHILLTRTHFREIKLVVEDKKLLGAAYTERVRQREMRIYSLYRARIEELKAAGMCRPIASSVIVFNTLAIINFIFQWYRPDGPLQLEDVADQTVELLTRGLLADAPPAAVRKKRAAPHPMSPRGAKK